MAVGYFNPRPAGGAFGGATTVVDPQFQAQGQGIPQWLVPAGLATVGAGAIGGGLALRHLNAQVPQASAPFNVGYGNGITQQPGTLAQQQVQQFSAQALQDRMLAQQQANQFVSQAPVTDLGRGISPADIRVNPISIPQGAGVGTGTPSFASLMGSNPYAEAAGVSPATSLPSSTAGIYNFAGVPSSEIPAALSTGQAAGSLLGGMFNGNMTSGPLARFSGPLAEDAGYLNKFGKSATSGTIARVGLAVGLPYLGSTFGHEFDQRGMTQAGQESRGLGRVMGMAGGAAGVPGAIAAAPAYAGTELLSNNQFGNDVLNTVRGSRSGADITNGQARDINPLAKVASVLNPLAAGAGAINAFGQLTGLVDKNREATADTVSDVFGGGGSGASKAQAAPLTPEQKAARVSPESLAATAKDYGLSDAMTQKLLKNYHQQMVMARENASVALPADNEGNVTLDGGQKVAAKDFPGAKQQKDSKGNMVWVTSDPDMVQQKVYDDMRQLIPTLGASQDQEEDFMRKQAVMQSQLEQVLPQLYNPAIWGADPTAQTLAMSESRAIPSRYVQAQALQAQQAYQQQVNQAMVQQQLAAQYPDLFGKKSNSGQPTTIDAAMQNG